MTATDQNHLTELTAEIVAAYVSNNTLVPAEVSSLIEDINEALSQAAARSALSIKEELKPAVSVKRSVQPDQITCLECGKKFKSLKRHIRSDHDLSPDEYRTKWALPFDYPMVTPNYAKARSKLAKKLGLGRKRK